MLYSKSAINTATRRLIPTSSTPAATAGFAARQLSMSSPSLRPAALPLNHRAATAVAQRDQLATQTARRNHRQLSMTAAAAASSSSSSSSSADPKMFCFQCEQTEHGTGCTVVGVCGKTPEVAKLQDLLVHACKSIGQYAHRLYQLGAPVDHKVQSFVQFALFATLTNVNFDPERFVELLRQAEECAAALAKQYAAVAGSSKLPAPAAAFKLNGSTAAELAAQGEQVGVLARKRQLGDDVVGLQELIMYGLKGTCAYAHHAETMDGGRSESFERFTAEVLDYLTNPAPSVNDLLGYALKVGEQNLDVMRVLDHQSTTHLGHPEPTSFRTSAVKGKCILVSGHDLHDLELILKQTEGKGINVYTHGEMLPAHGYPGLKKYKHLVGNFGGAWQLQKFEFAKFPGPIVLTSNCLVEPRKSYKDRVFTRHVVGFTGVKHVPTDDFSAVIDEALRQPGFTADEKETRIMTGFARNAVLNVAPAVVDAVKTGKIKHFFLIGGCDGSEGERNYFKEVAMHAPEDSVILTLACGKYRFNKLDFGAIGGIPRLLDIGQCNDAYSAIQIASALAGAFKTDINSLPLSFVISWFEQKAVAVLLTLLHLGVKNIRLGPNLPAFATPAMLEILQKNYNIMPISSDYQKDLQLMMQNK